MSSSPGLSPKAVGILSAVVTVLIWISFVVIARASAMRTLNPFDIAFCRMIGAGAVLIPWGWWLCRRQVAQGGRAGWLGLSPLPFSMTRRLGLPGGLLFGTLVYTGFFFAPAAHGSVLTPGSLPLWTTLLSAWLLRERIAPARAAGLAIILCGALLVGGTSLLHAFDGGSVWKGDLLFMSAAICWSTYSVLVRKHGIDAVRATIAIIVFAFTCYVPLYGVLALAGLVPSRLGLAPAGEILFQMAFQGLGGVVISGITFTKMIQYFGPVRTTMVTALVPGASALGAVYFLGEPLSWNLWAGLALVTVGIVFGVRVAAKPAPVMVRPA